MSDVTRREFLVAAGLAIPASLRFDVPAFPDALFSSQRLSIAMLRAVGEVVLPSELGSNGLNEVITQFIAWAEGYRAGAERNHGYGTANIGTLPDDPVPVWLLQLAQLNGAAQQQHGGAFTTVDRAVRTSLIEAALADDRSLGSPLGARHVVLALMSWFYASPRAEDLCYRARIGRESCRPLPVVTAPPAPLER